MARISHAAVQRQLAAPELWDLRVFDEVTSTNTLALDARLDRSPRRLAFLADTQTAGRGRGGREWRTPRGTCIAVSLVVRPKFGRELWPWIGIAAAFAVRDAIELVTGLSAQLKWPNDVLLRDRKVAGILTESRSASEEAPTAVVGVGVNVNNRADTLPRSFRDTATSLLDVSGTVTNREHLAARMLDEMWQAIEGIPATVERLQTRWRASSASFGAPLFITTPRGTVQGIDHGLDASGHLLLQTDDGLRHVHTGDVMICRTSGSFAT